MTNIVSFPKSGIQFRIGLAGIKPPIWRRFITSAGITLADLHSIIQTVMGWYDCHLHNFIIDGKEYGVPDEFFEDFDTINETGILVDDILGEKPKMMKYVYDFGDDWVHTLKFEKRVEYTSRSPVVIDGARNCPPEDSGGPYFYPELLEILKNPKNDQYEKMTEWLGGAFDPEHFDPLRINKRLVAK
jgi:hypothetical protein